MIIVCRRIAVVYAVPLMRVGTLPVIRDLVTKMKGLGREGIGY